MSKIRVKNILPTPSFIELNVNGVKIRNSVVNPDYVNSENIADGIFSFAGGYNSVANGSYSFVYGENSVAEDNTTIVLGSNLTGTSSNTVYVNKLNINSVSSGNSVNVLGVDINGDVIIGSAVGFDIYVTGGTYSNGSTTFTNNAGGSFNVNGYYTGYTAPQDVFVSGGTYSNGVITFDNTTGGTFDVTGLYTGYTAPQDVFVSGGTYSDGTTIFTNTTGGTFNVTGYYTGKTDNYITGGTFSHNTETLTLTNVTGGTIVITGFTDLNVTGGTYSAGTITFTNNTGGTFNVNGLFTGSELTNYLPLSGGTVYGQTLFTSGLTSTTMSASTYLNLPKLKNIVYVAQSGGDFTSIKDAVDSISGSSESNPYIVSVSPGKYYEDEIDLTTKPYVSVVGSSIETTRVYPNSPTQHLFKIGFMNELSFMSLNNVGSGYSAIYCDDIGDYAQAHKVSFTDCDTNITILSSTQDTTFYGEYIDFNGTFSYGTKVIANNGYTVYANMENYYVYPGGSNAVIGNSVQGSGATLTVLVSDGIGNGNTNSTNYEISDYALLKSISTTSEHWGYGVRVLNVGGPASFDIDSLSITDSSNYDLSIEHPNTFGTFGGGSSTHTKINNLSDSIYWGYLDVVDGEFEITRKISVTFQDGTHTDMSTLIFKGGTMGLISGGTISVVSGLTVNVSEGFGYLEKTISQEIYTRIDWVSSNITLPQNINYYLYFNENSLLTTSGSKPSSINNIILGRVVTNSTSISFIDESPLNADHTSNRYNNLFREAIGPIYAFGSIVTEGITPFTINVTSGEYYFSTNQYSPIGGSGLTFNQYYSNGSGGWNISATTLVNNTQFDNNGTLSGLTSSAYTKHTLYVVGDGSNEKYFLVLGQNQYQTLVEAENALLPTPPTFFNDSVTQLTNIYIRQGVSGITEFEDIRPVIGFKAGGVNASSLHANLLGLSSDDHKQYLLVDGVRSMSNNLNIGGNSIVSALTVNGVVVESHASRHKNGGADEISTSTPGPSEIPKSDTFGKLDSWISDASSSVKGLTRLSVNPLSSTIPIAVGNNDIRFQKSITGVTNSLGSLTFSNNSGGTISFSNLNFNSVSATTYYNLPTDVYVTGGTYSNGNVLFINNTGGTFNVSGLYTGYTPSIDIRVTGGTYSNGTTTFTNNTGGTFDVSGFNTGDTTLYWYAENATPPAVTPIATGTGSIALGDNAQALSDNMFVYGTDTGYQNTGSSYSILIGQRAGSGATDSAHSNFIGRSAGRGASNSSFSNFMGYFAASGATGSPNSNFIGYYAGSGATNASYNNFLGSSAGRGAFNTTYSNFQGSFAGYQANDIKDSNFIGTEAGYGASGTTGSTFIGDTAGYLNTGSSYSNFIGYGAGNGSSYTIFSNFIGHSAGYLTSGNSYSNFFGYAAGTSSTDNTYGNFIGRGAGLSATTSNNSNFIGLYAGRRSNSLTYSNAIGNNAGYEASGSTFANFIGGDAGYQSSGNSYSNFIGNQAGYKASNSDYSNFIGFNTGSGATSTLYSNFLGYYTGQGATGATYSNMMGYNVGKVFAGNNIGSNNIIIGTNISLPNARTNGINIGGVLFGMNTYGTLTGNPSTGTTSTGRIGINVVTPTEALHVSGNTIIDGSLNVTSNLTLNGNLTFTGQSNNLIYSAGTVTSTHIPNWNNSNIQTVVLSAATTNISGGTNIQNGAVYTIILKQNATGSRVVNWGSQYKWQSGIAPILTSTANSVDLLTFISDGVNLYGLIAKDFR